MLDQLRLRNDYKIQPYNDNGTDDLHYGNRYWGKTEFEEVVVANRIYPLDRYLVKIVVKSSDIRSALSELPWFVANEIGHTVEYWQDLLYKLLNHPLRVDTI